MDYIQIIGYAAAILNAAANFPQTYKIIKAKSTDNISVNTYLQKYVFTEINICGNTVLLV